MVLYKHIRETWKNNSDLIRQRMIQWRREPSVIKIERPTRLDRARSLGYKAKQGFLIARVKLVKSRRIKPIFKGGRKSGRMRRRKILNMSYQWVAEERANKKFHNFEVLNSYFLAKDGKRHWFEVILVDPHNPVIKADKQLSWMIHEKGRVYRGLTSAGRKSRGLLRKGIGAEKLRPSRKAYYKTTKSYKQRQRTAKK